MSAWAEGDDPQRFHADLSPECSWVYEEASGGCVHDGNVTRLEGCRCVCVCVYGEALGVDVCTGSKVRGCFRA